MNFLNIDNYGIYPYTDTIELSNINSDNYENDYYKTILNMINDHIDDKEIMTKKFKVIFEDGKIAVLNTIDLYINLIMWNLPLMCNLKITSEYLLFDTIISNKHIAEYINNVISKVIGYIDKKLINNFIADTIIKFNSINKFSYFIANTISLFDIVDLKERSPEVKKIFEDNMQNIEFTDIKEYTDYLAGNFKNAVITDGKSHLFDYLSTGIGFSLKQFRECIIGIGIKPNGLGGIFPNAIYNSFLNGGCNDPISTHIDASTARISQIIIESNVGKSGEFSNRLSYNNIDTLLHEDPNYACDTQNYVTVTIHNEKDLKLFNNRYYKFNDIEYCINYKTDKHLIGKTIQMRSPLTCSSYAKGNGICYRCYGKMAYINKGLNIGKIASDELSSACTQPQLSSKHILEAKIKKIVWDTIFNDFFIHDNYIISGKDSLPMDCNLIIDPSDINIQSADDDNDDDIFNMNNITITDVKIDSPNGLFNLIPDSLTHLVMLSPLIEMLDDHRIIDNDNDDELIIIPLNKLEGKELFTTPIVNDDLLNIIKNAQKCIGNKTLIESIMNSANDPISTLSTEFRNAVINDAGLKISPIHLETILASQVYTDNTCSERPNWSIRNPQYTIVDLKRSLRNNQSVVVSLINGWLSFVLSNVNTFKKEHKSMFDPLFAKCIYDYYEKNI